MSFSTEKRGSMQLITSVILAWILLSATAQATSFDCGKSITQVEKLVCGSDELSKLDDDLNKAFKTNIQVASNFLNISMFSIQDAQKHWLKKRNSCSDKDCIKDEYVARIAQLEKINKAEIIQNSNGIISDHAVCQTVAEYADTLDSFSYLRSLEAPESDLSPEFGDLRQIFGNDTVFGGTGNYWSVDMNGDAIPEYLTIYSGGTMNDMTAYVISSKKGSTVYSINDDDDGNLNLSLIKVGRKYFVLSNGNTPGKLWRVGKNGEFQLVCKFSQAQTELVIGKNNPVCSQVNLGHVKYVDYKFDNAVSSSGSGPWSVGALKGLAKVDVDNAGVVDNVVRIEADSSAGAGCGFIHIAVTNADGTSIPDTKLNKQLSGLDDFSCGSKQDVFVLNGKSYIDSQASSGIRTIHSIENKKANTICEFHRNISYEMQEIK